LLIRYLEVEKCVDHDLADGLSTFVPLARLGHLEPKTARTTARARLTSRLRVGRQSEIDLSVVNVGIMIPPGFR